MRRRWLVGVAVLLLPLALTAASRLLPRTNGRPVGPKDPATRQTVRLLRKGSTTQRAEAAKLLALLPEKRFVEVVPALVATLADPDPNIRVAVADVLASRLEDIEPLRRPLHEGEALVRREAAVTLGKMGEKATAAIPDLRQACEDPDPRVRVAATLALREVEAAELDRLLSRLHGEPIPEEDVLVGPLLDGLEDEDPVVRCWSASALLELVPNLRRLRWARQRLEGMFEQARSDAPGTILEQIAQGDPEELFFFVRQLRHDLPDVRLRAARSLRSLAREMKDLRALRAREAVQSLVQALDEPGEEFRSDVIQTLARVGPPDATPAIPRLLELVLKQASFLGCGVPLGGGAAVSLKSLGTSGQWQEFRLATAPEIRRDFK